MLDPSDVGSLKERFRGPVVESSCAEMSQSITVLVENSADRPVFYLVALILKPPAKIYIFTNDHIFPKSSDFKKEVLSYKEVAGGEVEKTMILARTLGPVSHME